MGAFDDMYMCSDCGIVTVPRFDPHECKMPTGVARTFKGALDRERWLRFCDAWLAIGLAATLELVIDDTPPWEPPRPRGAARNAIVRRLGIPAAEEK